MKPHTKDHTVYGFTGRKCLEQSNPQRQRVYLGLSGAGEGEWGVIAGVHGISFWGNKNVLELYSGIGYRVSLKVNFRLYVLILSQQNF